MQKLDLNKFDGWLGVNKEVGVSSAKVVSMIKKIMNSKKAGPAGTLAPLACGVLPIALGEATKTVKYTMYAKKSYEFDIKWGEATDTEDLEGKIINVSKLRPSKNDIINALKCFTGNIKQKPPSYSAIKIGGIRSYKHARNSIVVDLPEREFFIKSLLLAS